MIRSGVESDLPVVAVLMQRWAQTGETLGFRPSPDELLRAAVGHCFFVAEDEDRGLIGFIWGTVDNKPRHSAVVPEWERYLELQELYVVPESRSHGIGGQLVEAAIAWAKSSKIRYMVGFTATRALDRVLAFYRRFGLEPWAAQLFMDLERVRTARTRADTVA